MDGNSERVVVVTGASGGLGRAAAICFASKGYRVALAARRRESLEETARLCRDEGGRTLVVVTDVTREDDVAALGEATLSKWGRIDVWVNNAGVTLFAMLDEGSFEEHRRVIETNLFGPIFAARTVLPVFRKQGCGVLLNVGSILSKVGQPLVPSYVISKFALRGLSETLRMAYADSPDIHVCTLLPYAIDTPHFQVGANRLGSRMFAMPPVQSPEDVACALVDLAENPRREVHVPGASVLGLAARWLMPETCERLIAHAVRRWHASPWREARTAGNLFHESAEYGSIHGRRPPRIGNVEFAAWVGAEVVKIEIEQVLTWSGRVLDRATSAFRSSPDTPQASD